LQQFTDITAGVIPMMILSAAGYDKLNGCECGCGVSCNSKLNQPYLRWHCPNSVAYTCSGDLDEDLLFAVGSEGYGASAPCTMQNDAVKVWIQMLMLLIPGFFALLAAIPALRAPITAAIHSQITEQIASRKEGGKGHNATDPLTGAAVVLPLNTPNTLFKEHFTTFEQEGNTRGIVGVRLVLWIIFGISMLVLMAIVGSKNMVTVGCLCLMGVFVAVPWEVARLRLLLSTTDAVFASISSHDACPINAASSATSACSKRGSAERAGVEMGSRNVV